MNTMNATTHSAKIQHGKCTLYFAGLMGIVKVEAKDASTDVRPYAQYARGVYCAFRRARERLARGFVQSFQPSLLILEGWGHPEPDGIFEDAPAVAAGEAVSQRGRYASCDPRWSSDFNGQIDAYIAKTGTKVLADFRGHDPGCR